MVKRHTPDSEEEEEDASSGSSSEEAQTAAKGVSEYEKQRLSRIAENKARLEALGLPKMASSLKGHASINNKGKKKKTKLEEDDDDDDEYRPNEEEPVSDSSSQDDESDKDEDFVVGNASGSRKRKVMNKGSKMKAKVSGKKHCSSNSEYNDDEDEALRQAIALSLQDTAEDSTDKHVVNMSRAEKKGSIHSQEDKGIKKNKKSFASRLQMTEDELIVHFFQLDEAGKGTVSIRDIQRAAIAHDFVWTDKELVDMIRCFDSNGDGKLSFDDFKKIVVRCKMIEGSL